jgi:hypothetical protein
MLSKSGGHAAGQVATEGDNPLEMLAIHSKQSVGDGSSQLAKLPWIRPLQEAQFI